MAQEFVDIEQTALDIAVKACALSTRPKSNNVFLAPDEPGFASDYRRIVPEPGPDTLVVTFGRLLQTNHVPSFQQDLVYSGISTVSVSIGLMSKEPYHIREALL